jgi:hypothetical protein
LTGGSRDFGDKASGRRQAVTAAVATAILLRRPRLNPLILFGISGVLFAVAAAINRV